ncbi:DNA-binding MarR family transcriptional regulator [Leucobacter exalbidus]|uniref:DNA-binding MarR family transcriptional regulator n=1 Tax=Leucobacter exalbidus TaxID=662960 RepID=A0A940PWU0_9MICO|nr:MarR family winged helix-turn-helix transcriptional regulator [Leucobacter exalbidus]MBP1326586.1 DNA-binding MarR family transcriptional regulator [Leucobacter exalbidus]
MNSQQSPPIDDATAVELWGRVIHGFQVTNRGLHAKLKAQFNLNEAEVETLLSLFRCPENRSRHNFLAKSAGFSTGGFTKIADKLTTRGLTQRIVCTDDRRAVFLELTPEGLTLSTELASTVAAHNRAGFIDVLGAERAHLVAEAMTDLYRANSDATPA